VLDVRPAPKGLVPGASVRLVIRPETIEIAHADTGPLHATIESRTFLGEKIEYVVRCAAEVLQIVRYNAGPGDIIPEGAAVSLRIGEGALTVLNEVSTGDKRHE